MIYLVAGLDRRTLGHWHDHVTATDATDATRIARSRAAGQGLELVVAAVIGPYCSIEPFAADVPSLARAGQLRTEAA